MTEAALDVNEQFLDPRYGATILERMPIFKGFSHDERARIDGAMPRPQKTPRTKIMSRQST